MSLKDMWNNFVAWVKNNWRTPVAVVASLVACLLVVLLGVVAYMMLFGVPLTVFREVFVLSLWGGLTYKYGTKLANFVANKIALKSSNDCSDCHSE